MSTYNNFKSTTVRGNFTNSDYADGSVLANGTFDRNLTIKNNLYLGKETTNYDASGNITGYTDTGGQIYIKYNGTQYIITPAQLIQLSNTLASQSYVNTQISSLVNSAPSTLDTLYELAGALGNDPNFATTIATQIGTKTSLTEIQNNNNSWTGTNSYNTSLPTSNLTPTTSTHFITKGFGDNTYTTLTAVQANNNLFSGVSTFLNNIVANTVIITPTVFSYIGTLTSNAQTQINNRVTTTTAQTISGVKTFTANIIANSNTITPTAFGYIAGLTSDAQTQINAKADTSYLNTQLATKTTLAEIQSNNNTWTGTNAFNTSLPTSTLTPTNNGDFTTKVFVDTQLTTKGNLFLSTIQSNNNSWTGTNSYNTSLPTSTLTPTTSTHFITKGFGDNTYTTLTAVQANNNLFSGVSTFSNNIIANSNTITPTAFGYIAGLTSNAQTQINAKADTSYLNTQLATKTTLAEIQSNNNTWTGTNAFNTSLPTSTLTPTNNGDFTTKVFVDTQLTTKGNLFLSTIQSNNNSWTGTNSYNTSLPTSTLTPTTSTQFITKGFGDNTYTTLTAVQANNNLFSGVSTFLNNIVANTITITPTVFSYIAGLTSDAQTQINAKADTSYLNTQLATKTTLAEIQSNNNSWTGTNAFNVSLPTSTLTPTNNGDFTTKVFVDTQLSPLLSATTGISYASATDTTTIDNNLTITTGKALILQGYNVHSALNSNVNKCLGFTRNSTTSTTTFTDNLVSPTLVVNNRNVLSELDALSSTKATITYVDTKVANLVNSAPATLDTLGEIATQLGNDELVTTSILNSIGNINTTLTNISYSSGTTTIGNHLDLSGKNINNAVSINGTYLNTNGNFSYTDTTLTSPYNLNGLNTYLTSGMWWFDYNLNGGSANWKLKDSSGIDVYYKLYENGLDLGLKKLYTGYINFYDTLDTTKRISMQYTNNDVNFSFDYVNSTDLILNFKNASGVAVAQKFNSSGLNMLGTDLTGFTNLTFNNGTNLTSSNCAVLSYLSYNNIDTVSSSKNIGILTNNYISFGNNCSISSNGTDFNINNSYSNANTSIGTQSGANTRSYDFNYTGLYCNGGDVSAGSFIYDGVNTNKELTITEDFIKSCSSLTAGGDTRYAITLTPSLYTGFTISTIANTAKRIGVIKLNSTAVGTGTMVGEAIWTFSTLNRLDMVCCPGWADNLFRIDFGFTITGSANFSLTDSVYYSVMKYPSSSAVVFAYMVNGTVQGYNTTIGMTSGNYNTFSIINTGSGNCRFEIRNSNDAIIYTFNYTGGAINTTSVKAFSVQIVSTSTANHYFEIDALAFRYTCKRGN